MAARTWVPGVILAAAVAAAAPARAQEGLPAGAAGAARWSFDATAIYFDLPDDEDYVQPQFVARRDRLHLEARWNYEDIHTASIFGGWAFGGGSEFEWEAIPILGAVFGETDGVAPGCIVSLSWKELQAYSEIEYVAVFADRESNFLYAWSEITWDPVDAFGAGMVVQRTRVYETDRDTQRGVMARYTHRAFTGAVYWFNPGSSDDFVAISVGAGF